MSRSGANRSKGPGNPAPVDADARAAYRAMYGQPTRAKSFPVAPVPECPADARAALLLAARNIAPLIGFQSLAEVESHAHGKAISAVHAWSALQLCTRDEMRRAWRAFERRRAAAVVDWDAGIKREWLAARFISHVQMLAIEALSTARTADANSAWVRDLGSAIDRVAKVLSRRPVLDQLDIMPGIKAAADVRLSDALRAYHLRLAGLRDLSAPRARRHAQRRVFAVALTRWCAQFLDTECPGIVAAAVSVLFGADYSTRQLCRDKSDS